MKQRQILLGLTTSSEENWRHKIEEIERYAIEEVALFPTYIPVEERKKLYSELEKTGIKRIPHVHLRHDMQTWELEYLEKKYHTQLFNVHGEQTCLELIKQNPSHSDKIFVENTVSIDEDYMRTLHHCAGICLDVSHLVDQGIKQRQAGYDFFISTMLPAIPVGCCHISAIHEKPTETHDKLKNIKIPAYSWHSFDDISQFDYVNDYVHYLPEYISLELDNPFSQQIKAKQYIESIVNE